MSAEANKATIEAGAESPTTARPLEMDDEEQETGIVGQDGTTVTAKTTSPARSTIPLAEAPPAKPPRPVSEKPQNDAILKEAFPTVDLSVIKAVLRASGGRVEPAFNALLEMTDPDAVVNEPAETPPPQPPRPQGRTDMSQVEADELYARQLAQHYDNVGAYEARTSNRSRGSRQRQDMTDEDREHSFLEDDLPIIRDNLRKGFIETQSKVNGWITNFRKKIEDNFDESSYESPPQPPRRSGEASRRSGDYERYDADPQVLGDDFAGIKLSPDGTPVNRPMGSGLHKPPPLPSMASKQNEARRVGFKDEQQEIDMYDASPTVPPKDAPPGTKASKWQPLSTVEPTPMTDNDPFSLGDSEDERDAKDKPKTEEGTQKAKDAERLQQAAAEAMSDTLVQPGKGDEATGQKGS
ncbi:hypothetical protein CDD82_3164 [Ophiocordyceps australis]|uniref:CUE domain-containing protein n=1 Tax=Ophiocordyceps australis TaxID=1399860 RepID=A0A2C5ZFK9_9HYPO|nr:hypothetical protein CDD82_3164 [Ophiocordyceps australis]